MITFKKGLEFHSAKSTPTQNLQEGVVVIDEIPAVTEAEATPEKPRSDETEKSAETIADDSVEKEGEKPVKKEHGESGEIAEETDVVMIASPPATSTTNSPPAQGNTPPQGNFILLG